MKKLPTIYRTKFKKGVNMFLDPVSHSPRNMGFYIEKGNFIASYKNDDNKDVPFYMDEGTIVVSSHMKKKGEESFSSYGNEHYVQAVTKGWNIRSDQDSSIIICFFYPDENAELQFSDEIFVPSYKDDNFNKLPDKFAKLPYNEYLTLADVIQTKEEKTIYFPKDYYLYVVKGPVSINGVIKNKKTWIVSSKNQELQIDPLEDKEIIIILAK